MEPLGSTSAPVLAYWLPSSATLVSLCVLLLILTVQWYLKHRVIVKIVDKIPGPYALPLIGNAFDINVAPEQVFTKLMSLHTTWGYNTPLVRVWIGPHPVILLISPSAVEAVLGSKKHITKSHEYSFIQPWLGKGLLTSTGEKWYLRRKVVAPAFHVKILETFIEVFNEQSEVLVEKLHEAMLETGETGFDVFPYITRCTLDIICDSAMGKHVGAQSHGECEYVQAVHRIQAVIQSRQLLPWLQPNLLFKLSSYAPEQKQCLQILHGFTNQVIQEKKLEYQCQKTAIQNGVSEQEEDKSCTTKKRLAFLDLLISASDGGKLLSDSEIREEVDTIMFAGHDTTAAGISWCLFLIGSNPEIQEQVFEEIRQVLDDDFKRPITKQDLTEFKYLECCIKEAQRLYPSVPIMAREFQEDVHIEGYEVPEGSTMVIFPYSLHRNATIFPDPEAFMPERFFPDYCRGRHPYAYVPFSAGPRNCIGQKYALMEVKVVLAHVFRRFQVKSVDKREDLCLLGELVLRPKDGLKVSFTERQVKTRTNAGNWKMI